jgi:hypothetical protein
MAQQLSGTTFHTHTGTRTQQPMTAMVCVECVTSVVAICTMKVRHAEQDKT